MDKNIVYPILDWLGQRLRPRNLYTNNWLGAGRLDWSEQKRSDGDGLYYRFSVGIDHVTSCSIMQVCPGGDAIGFYGHENNIESPQGLILDVGDPDFFEKLSVFCWENITRHHFTESRLSYGPKEGFKPVVWRPCRVVAYPWADIKDIDKAIFEGVDIAI